MQTKNTSGDIRLNTHKKTLAHTDTSHTHKHTYTHTYVYTYTAVHVHSLTSSIVSALLTISEKRSKMVAENLAKTKLSYRFIHFIKKKLTTQGMRVLRPTYGAPLFASSFRLLCFIGAGVLMLSVASSSRMHVPL